MIFVVLVTLVSLLISPENALRTPPEKVRAQKRIFPPILHKQNRDELRKIINALNSRSYPERTKEVDDEEGFAYSFETKKLEEVMKLIQKNYDANNLRKDKNDGGVRIHVIKNPEILEQYVRNIKEGAFRSSDSSSDSGVSDWDGLDALRDSYLRDYLSRLLIKRRSAKFRLDKHDSMDLKDDNGLKEVYNPKKKLQQSFEDQITKFYNSYENKKESTFKEVTTKKHKKKINNKIKTKSKNKTKQSKTQEWTVINHYSKEEPVGMQNTEKRANNWWDDTEKDDTIKNNGWDIDNTIKRQPKTSPKKKMKVAVTKDPWGSAEAEWVKKPKKTNDYFHEDMPASNKYKDDFQDEVPLKKEEPSYKRKQTDNWDQPKVAKANAQPVNDWSNEKETYTKFTKKNEWDGYEKTTRFRREPKRKPKEYYREPSYSYVKPRDRMGKDGFHLFGRTPIPLVGKQGIYEE